MRKFFLSTILLFFITLAYSQDTVNNNGYNVFHYANGRKSSEGNLYNGKPDGYWKTYYENGVLKSEGYRKNFELDSTWKFYSDSAKTVLEINYKTGKKNGIRKTYQKDEIIAENFVDDVKQGGAFSYYSDGKLKRKTNYIDGREEGFAREYAHDGRIITLIEYKKGFIVNSENINRNRDGMKHGLWKEFYENEMVFTECEYSYGKKDGYYKEFDINGNLIKILKYINDELQFDVPELISLDVKTDYYKDGKVKIVASYKDGIPEGVRREYSHDGQILKGYIYKNGIIIGEGIVDEKGLRQGLWKEFYESGEMMGEGVYKDNKRQGEWKFYYKDGKVEQTGKYNNSGRPTGLWKWFYSTGNLRRSESFKNGIPEGELKELSDSGSVIITGNYLDGEEDGEWFYDVNGEKEKGTFQNGKREGEWKHYYFDVLTFQGKFVDGNQDGEALYFYNDNGKLKEKGKFMMGKKEGEWIKFNPDGTRLLSIFFEDGLEIKFDGNKIDAGVER
jgi:antitoxin component YwqK of YwqJK toxin-antitoxin module